MAADDVAEDASDDGGENAHHQYDGGGHLAADGGFDADDGKGGQPEGIEPTHGAVEAFNGMVEDLGDNGDDENEIKVVEVVQPEDGVAVEQQVADGAAANAADEGDEYGTE